MKQLAVLSFFLLFSSLVSAQEGAELAVVGKSSIALKPTQTAITYTVRSTQSSYVAAVEDMTTRVDELAGILSKLKFGEKELVTSSFAVQEKFAYDRGQRRNDGYVATQLLQVSFPLDKKRLLDVLSKTTSGLVNAEIAIDFTLDDARKQSLQLELIEMAVRDAKTKAETIAKASDYVIAGIKDISYAEPVAVPRPQMARMEMSLAAADAGGVDVSNLEAADLTFTDSVHITYFIKPSK